MTFSKIAKALLLAATVAAPATVFGEDIDLYQGGAEITGNRPNVLIILDNSANWAAANQGWPGGIKQGESELNALASAINAQTSEIRVGLMMFTDAGPNGGYVRYGIREMNAANRTAFATIATGIKPSFNSPTEKVASAKTNYSNVMYEAYRYFGNQTRYAAHDDKRDYTGNGSYNVSPFTAGNVTGNAFANSSTNQYQTPLSAAAPCSKNFIIFIGNGYPSQDTAPTALGDANLRFSGSTSDPNYFDTTQIVTSSSATNANYADEWARFLKEKGTPTVCSNDTPQVCANSQVITYTIDVYKDHQDPDQTALLKSMAKVGGGTYCQASSEQGIKDCLNNIFNETQAVDSVFTSASLPVSVNTQGTYLNQIYMGVFRPDNGGRPRWLGNLKEYRFGLTKDAAGNDTIYLADSTTTNGVATPVVNNVTGFIKPSAVSYWTSSTAPAAGFWAFKPTGLGGQYDSPDGDLVEKGAAAQKLRTLGHASRTVYTCPAGGCTANSTPNLFNTANTGLVSGLSGASSTITSLTRAGTTVTVNTSGDLGLASPTDTVTISGASVGAFNSTWTATKVSATRFTFTIAETPVTPATGNSITIAAGSGVSQAVTPANMTYSGGLVYVNLPGHGFTNGQSVTISGANVSASMATATTKCAGYPLTTTCEYNGTFAVTVIDANNFAYTPPSSNLGSNSTYTTTYNIPETFVASLGSAQVTCRKNGNSNTTTTATITSITRPSGTGSRTVTVVLNSGTTLTDCSTDLSTGNGNGVVVGVAISGSAAENGLSGSYTPTSAGTTCSAGNQKAICFTVTVTSSQTPSSTTTISPASPATTGSTIFATGVPTKLVSSITRTDGNASNVATVTVTTATSHGFAGSTSVIVSGADQSDYNGTKTTAANSLAFPTANTITYTLTTGPAATASGGSVGRGSSVDAATLINWVRGMDNKEDENQDGSLTDTRASVHGDVLHSRPVVINYGGSTGLVAFYGANDGTLRAVKAGDASTDGGEKWAFVAPEHYSTLGRLYNDSPVIKFPTTSAALTPTPEKRNYFFDGNIGVYQSPNLATTHIFATMRRGGRVIYAFNVSNPDDPRFLWKKSYTDSGFSELGFTWSEPKVIMVKKTTGVACSVNDSTTYTRALVFGAGYDPTEEDKDNLGTAGVVRNPTMGRGVFVVNASDGSLIKLLQPADTKKYSFPADVTLLDTDSDGCVDRIYAVDTGANIHRFDIGDADKNNWKTYKLAALGDTDNNGGSNDRKFLYPADSVIGYIAGVQTTFVMVGSGNRELPRDENVTDMFFMIKDAVQAGADPATVNAAVLADLTPVTDFNAATTAIDPTPASFRGWYITMETGEKIVNAPLTVAGTTYFGTNMPKAASFSCTPNLGVARGYQVNYLNGTAAAGDKNGDGTVSRSDLYTKFAGGGLPPSPVSGVVKVDDKFVRFVIGGGCGTEGAFIEGCKVQANPASNRTRAYWYFKKDN